MKLWAQKITSTIAAETDDPRILHPLLVIHQWLKVSRPKLHDFRPDLNIGEQGIKVLVNWYAWANSRGNFHENRTASLPASAHAAPTFLFFGLHGILRAARIKQHKFHTEKQDASRKVQSRSLWEWVAWNKNLVTHCPTKHKCKTWKSTATENPGGTKNQRNPKTKWKEMGLPFVFLSGKQ